MQPSRYYTFPPFLLLLVLAGMAAGFVQEIIFHEKLHGDGNQFIFRSQIPDTTAIAQLGPFSKICYRGMWALFSDKNYITYTTSRGSYLKAGDLTCLNGPLNFQSARHYVARETEEAAISLYRNKSYSGPAILVLEDELSGIEMPVTSCTWSAAAQWTLFEGQYFTGKSTCLPPPIGDRFAGWYSILNLTNVGSVVKTCDPVRIQLAMQKHNVNI